MCATLQFTKLFQSFLTWCISNSHIYIFPSDQTSLFSQSTQFHRKYTLNVLLFATLSVRCFSSTHIWKEHLDLIFEINERHVGILQQVLFII